MDMAAPSRDHRHAPASNADQPRGLIGRIAARLQRGARGIEFAAPLLDLGVRIYVASVFLQSGLTKIASWQQTLALFETEYVVPLLPPALAATLGTAAELVLPVLLVFGLGTRLAAIALFLFNIVAVLSYPDLSDAGLQQHQVWGLLMLVTIFHGPGTLSLDHLIGKLAGRLRG